MTGLRALAAVGALARRRVASAPGRWLPLAFAVAAACAFAGTMAGASLVAGDHAARRVLARAPAADHRLLMTWNGGATSRIDGAARHGVGEMGGGPVTRAIVLGPTRFGRRVVRLAALSRARRWLALEAGRLPRGPCRARRCEVVRIEGGDATPIIDERGVRIAVVGRARLPSAVPLGFTRQPSTQQRPPLLLVASDPAGLDALAATRSVARVQAWTAPYPLDGLHAWNLAAALARLRVGAAIAARTDPGLSATAPQHTLMRARSRAQDAPRRLVPAAATAMTALLAFAVLCAVALRRGLLAEDGRLRRGGATRPQRATLAALETAAPLAAGLLAGTALALGGSAIRAAAGGVGPASALGHSGGRIAAAVVAVAAVAWVVALVTAAASARALRVAAAALLLATAAALAGTLLPRADGDPVPGAVIPLATAAAGLAAGLAAPSALAAWARVRGRRPLTRLGAVELARDPGPPAVAIAAMAVAVGLAVFALSFRATLRDSQRDQAAHRVALAAAVVPGASLRSPLRVAPPARWSAAAGGGAVAPVVRRDAFAVVGPSRAPVTLLGAPSQVLRRVASPHRAPPALRGPPATRGLALAPSARTLELRARSPGAEADVSAAIRMPAGVMEQVPLGRAGGRPATLRANLPAAARGGRLVAVLLAAPGAQLALAGHQAAEGGTGSDLARGVASISDLRVDGRPAPGIGAWTGHGAAAGHPQALRFTLGGADVALLRPPAAIDRAPLAVLADPRTARDAGPGGALDLDVEGVTLPARVAGTIRSVPTVATGAAVVVADAPSLGAALDARRPGAGEPRELWIAAPARPHGRWERSLAVYAARAGAAVALRSAVERDLRSDPVSREVLGALTAAAVLAAVLAILGACVAVGRALRDGARGLADLEGQGVGPGALRSMLRHQAIALAAGGVVAGAAVAALLSPLAAGAVRAAAGAAPDPPLTLVFPWLRALAAAAAVAALAVVASALAVSGALREPTALGASRGRAS